MKLNKIIVILGILLLTIPFISAGLRAPGISDIYINPCIEQPWANGTNFTVDINATACDFVGFSHSNFAGGVHSACHGMVLIQGNQYWKSAINGLCLGYLRHGILGLGGYCDDIQFKATLYLSNGTIMSNTSWADADSMDSIHYTGYIIDDEFPSTGTMTFQVKNIDNSSEPIYSKSYNFTIEEDGVNYGECVSHNPISGFTHKGDDFWSELFGDWAVMAWYIFMAIVAIMFLFLFKGNEASLMFGAVALIEVLLLVVGVWIGVVSMAVLGIVLAVIIGIIVFKLRDMFT